MYNIYVYIQNIINNNKYVKERIKNYNKENKNNLPITIYKYKNNSNIEIIICNNINIEYYNNKYNNIIFYYKLSNDTNPIKYTFFNNVITILYKLKENKSILIFLQN